MMLDLSSKLTAKLDEITSTLDDVSWRSCAQILSLKLSNPRTSAMDSC